jgi:hypothetical protein
MTGYAPGIVCHFPDLAIGLYLILFFSFSFTIGTSAGHSTDSDSQASLAWKTMVGSSNVSDLLTPLLCLIRLPSVTPAFYGAGMLSGLNASWSFCG